MAEAEFTIGHLARQTGVKIPTIRYYEQVGLLPVPNRSRGNQRRYGAGYLTRLTFISHCRQLGFSQAGIRDLLDLSDHSDQSCSVVTDIARERCEEIDRRIARLVDLRAELSNLIVTCGGGPMKDCRILEALAEEAGGPGSPESGVDPRN